MEHLGFLSLIPIIITVIVAIKYRNIILALFLGVFIGILFLVGGNPVTATTTLVKEYLFSTLADSYNAGVIILLAFIGGFVALIEKSGGASAFAKSASKVVNTRAKAQVFTWLGGIIVFFSELGTPLIVGPIFEPLYDKMKVSREKLAWILDTTASPVSVLVPFIGWGVYSMGLIQKEFEVLNIAETDWTAFIKAIPFQFYPILSIIMVPLVAYTGYEFSAMAKAERRIKETGKIYWDSSKPMREYQEVESVNENVSPIVVWLPLLIMFITLFALLMPLGFPFHKVAGSMFRTALITGYLYGSIALVGLMAYYKVKTPTESINIYFKGMSKMTNVVIILILAWALGAVGKEMGTANYIIQIAQGNVPTWLVPALVFIIGSVISFSTGTSWGTFAIMMPLAIPMAVTLGAPLHVCIGAVLSGGLFGDHCSPISDTTILASTGAGCDHIDHVKTQIPYAMINGAVALIGYVVAGFNENAMILFGVIALMIVSYVSISKIVGEKVNDNAVVDVEEAV
jgi:Na+/H+ antiporter NhaC